MINHRTALYALAGVVVSSSTFVGIGAGGETNDAQRYCHADAECIAVYAGCGLDAVNYEHLKTFKASMACIGSSANHPNPQDGCSGNDCIIDVPAHCVANQCALFDTRDIE